MAKTKISEFDIDPANNTDINSINIAEGCAPSGINNAIRQLMSDLKEFQTGAGGDSITATGVYSDTIGEKTSAAGVTVDGVLLKDNGITASGTNVLSGTTIPSSKTLVVTTDIGSTVQAYDADTTKNDVANTFTANQIISVTDNTNAALRITQLGTGNALLVEDSSNPDSTPFVINSGGQVASGYTSQPFFISGVVPNVGSIGTSNTTGGFVAANYSNDTNPAWMFLGKSRGAIGSQGLVSSGDSIGNFDFAASDGTIFTTAARITAAVDGTPGTNDMPGRLVFSTTADGASSPTERMRIDSAGRVGIGGSAQAGDNLYIPKNITGATVSYGVRVQSAIQSDVTDTVRTYQSAVGTAASAFTLTNLAHFQAIQTTIGAGSTVTNQYGFNVASSLTGATNNYGFYSNIASGTGRYNFYAAGTADNYFAGNVGIGTSSPEAKFHVSSGTQFDANSAKTTSNLLLQGTGTAGADAYGGAVTFCQINSSRPWGAIAGVQYSTDVDQGGLSFLTHGSSTTNDALTERMRLDSSGNLGLGVTPSAWSTSYKALEINGISLMGSTVTNDFMSLGVNFYFNGTNWIYKSSEYATRYYQVDGTHQWYTAPSGTAGNAITFTQAMTLDASGNLLLGTTTTGSDGLCMTTGDNIGWVLNSGQSTATIFRQASTAALVLANGYRYSATSGGYASSYSSSWAKSAIGVGVVSGTITFYTDTAATVAAGTDVTPTERMRIDSSGNLLVGLTSATSGGGVLQVSNGITFPATQSASSNANTLDDYEEGTFTPVMNFGGAAAFSSVTANGKYTKVGNCVTFEVTFGAYTKTANTGNAQITGMPFAFSDLQKVYIAQGDNLTYTSGAFLFCYNNGGGTDINPYQQAAGTATQLTNTAFGNNGTFRVCGSYFTT